MLFVKILEDSTLRLRGGSELRGRTHRVGRDTVDATQMAYGTPGSIFHVL